MAKKVVHVIVGLHVGGAEKFLSNLITEFSKRPDFEHSLISLTDLGKFGVELESQGISVTALKINKGLISLCSATMRFQKIIRRTKPDIVHLWMLHAFLFGGIISKIFTNSKIVWSIRNDCPITFRNKVDNIIFKFAIILSRFIPDTIQIVSSRSADRHIKAGICDRKVRVIPNWVNIPDTCADVDSSVIALKKKGDIWLTSVARGHPIKDHKNFFIACKPLLKAYPNLRVISVGRNVRSLAVDIFTPRELERMIFLGEINYVVSVLRMTDIYCLHSLSEGCPNSLLEACSLGIPCISTDVGDVADILPKVCVVDVGKSEELRNAIVNLLEMPEGQLKETGMRNKNYVMQHFSKEKILDQFDALYQ